MHQVAPACRSFEFLHMPCESVSNLEGLLRRRLELFFWTVEMEKEVKYSVVSSPLSQHQNKRKLDDQIQNSRIAVEKQ